MKVLNSVSNTVGKTLSTVDDVIDGTSYAAKIYKTAMEQSYRETLTESMIEQNKLIAENSTLTEAQLLILASPL
jgi:hypothetical protein